MVGSVHLSSTLFREKGTVILFEEFFLAPLRFADWLGVWILRRDGHIAGED